MMMVRNEYIVLHDDVEGNAEGQFVWASVYELPQIHQLKPGVGYAADTCTEPGALRPGELPARVCNIRRYVGTGDFVTVVAPSAVAPKLESFGATVNGDLAFIADTPGQYKGDRYQLSFSFDGTVGYARENQLALFDAASVLRNGFGLRREGGDFGVSADATGDHIVGRIAGREGGRVCVRPPGKFAIERATVTVAGKPVACEIVDGEVRFDVQITHREGWKGYRIAF
jgi:hypothetical protein